MRRLVRVQNRALRLLNHTIQSSTTRSFHSESILFNQQQKDEKYTVLSVDTSSLVQETYKNVVKENETPMVKHLKNKIKGAGPISVSTFIQESLLNPIYGYYYTAKKDTVNPSEQNVIGREGDFVTSPEITSVFGEMIGLWCVNMWERMGRPKNLEIVELGPGKGTLMHDLLDSLEHTSSSTIQGFKSALKKVNFIEGSEALKEVQKDKLKNFLNKYQFQWENRFEKYADIQSGNPVLIIAHEFFDALPVYHFEVSFLTHPF